MGCTVEKNIHSSIFVECSLNVSACVYIMVLTFTFIKYDSVPEVRVLVDFGDLLQVAGTNVI